MKSALLPIVLLVSAINGPCFGVVVEGDIQSALLDLAYGDSGTPDAFLTLPASSKTGHVSVDLNQGLVTYSGYGFSFHGADLTRFYLGASELIRVEIHFDPLTFTQNSPFTAPIERLEADRALVLDGLPWSVWSATPLFSGRYNISASVESFQGPWSTPAVVSPGFSFGDPILLSPDATTPTSLTMPGAVAIKYDNRTIFNGVVDGQQLTVQLQQYTRVRTNTATTIPEPSLAIVWLIVCVGCVGVGGVARYRRSFVTGP